MSTTLPYFSAAEVHSALDYPRLVEALGVAFAAGASTPVRHVHTVAAAEGARLLLMPAWREGEALAVKVVTVFPGNSARAAATVAATVLLLDGRTGHPRALLDGEALTLRRTGAASALASRFLSRADSSCLLMVGAGQLAPYLAHAHCSVRPIRQIFVWARRPEAAQRMADRLQAEGLNAQPIAKLSAGLRQADIVSCATTSIAPIILGDQVVPGTHVDLVGGFTPQMREADDVLMSQASVFVDTRSGAIAEAGDLTQPIEAGLITPASIQAELADLATHRHPGRRDRQEITVFKSVGTALEDLAAAVMVVAPGAIEKRA